MLADCGVAGELTLSFVDRDDIAELNVEHMGVTGPTDVLSFPMDDEPLPGVPTLLGDVVISVPTAQRQAHELGHDLDHELKVLLVHGICHLLGHDHHEPEEARRMRALEAALLAAVGGDGVGLIERASLR